MWVFISLAAIVTIISTSWYADILIQRFTMSYMLENSFLNPYNLGIFINILHTLLLLLTLYSILQASQKNKFPASLSLLAGLVFMVVPILLVQYTELRAIRWLWSLPFHPAKIFVINLNVPFSRLYYTSGFLFIGGILGLLPKFITSLFQFQQKDQ